ncbi:hypothetical protein FIBSPDRAFT_964554 [Athelia psychrophila]|uniref:Uncharacterized protein n=1 Tax=Athelia psychrophila TaxID=1759441 RepID=A0A165XP20_9AGAM|nr:hypothetical protein FIBSPDRAFT_964550 [Fibularhizoctonia sp. CBS 109695]KZP08746.1 hypothetical protein FIBSPDRAFT_964554 [Fibularhizoctonia sp. CBS 109695]
MAFDDLVGAAFEGRAQGADRYVLVIRSPSLRPPPLLASDDAVTNPQMRILPTTRTTSFILKVTTVRSAL